MYVQWLKRLMCPFFSYDDKSTMYLSAQSCNI